MRPNAVVINVGRGPVIDEPALFRALETNQIRGAALDVFEASCSRPDIRSTRSRTSCSRPTPPITLLARESLRSSVVRVRPFREGGTAGKCCR